MNLPHLSKRKPPKWFDWVGLGLMAFAAPVIGVLFHSLCVYYRGHDLYNAEIREGNTWRVVLACSVPAIPTFFAILPFRRSVLHRWMAWTAFVIFWTPILFSTEAK